MQHPPLSQSLTQILENHPGGQAVTLNDLLRSTDGRGLYLVIILLSLPFIGGVSVPGISVPFGAVIGILSFRLALGHPPHIPKRFGDRPLPKGMKKIILGGGVRFLRFIEKGIKPRRPFWMGWRLARMGNALLLFLMAFLMALPLPPIPPFTNALPSSALILIAASMMEEDGLMIWFGYAMALGTVIYLAFWAGVIGKHFVGWYHSLVHYFTT